MLFGALVHHALVTGVTLSIALRYVLEALRSGPASKMFRFALTALRGFREDLHQWPDYARQLLQVRRAGRCGWRLGVCACVAAAGGVWWCAGTLRSCSEMVAVT